MLSDDSFDLRSAPALPLAELDLLLNVQMKLLSTAFALTIEKFDITVFHLAKRSTVSAGSIANFCNGVRGITTDSLEKLLGSLSEEEFIFWLSQVAHARGIEEFVRNPVALSGFVESLDEDDAAELLLALAKKIRSSSREKASLV